MYDPHTVTEEQFDAWADNHWSTFAGSYCDASNKSLEVSPTGLYRVLDHRNVVYEGQSKQQAIAAYNRCP